MKSCRAFDTVEVMVQHSFVFIVSLNRKANVMLLNIHLYNNAYTFPFQAIFVKHLPDGREGGKAPGLMERTVPWRRRATGKPL